MPKIFVSYRRADLVASALLHSIDDRLVAHFGRDNVFVDIDSIPLGKDFRQIIFDSVGACDVVVVLIGDRWVQFIQQNQRERNDFVRLEIEAAIERGIPIIPILIGGAKMPGEADLPRSIRTLTHRNGMLLDHGRDFDHHVRRLIRELDQLDTSDLRLVLAKEHFDGRDRVGISESTFELLREFLDHGNWKRADYLTGRMMLTLTKRNEYGWLDLESVSNCPLQYVKRIDNLWSEASKGKFCYSKQAEIYRRFCPAGAFRPEEWTAFAEHVGWKRDGSWILYNDMTFSLSAAEGHLPDGFVAVQIEDGSVVRWWVPALAQRAL
jgi:hypothetical protein